MLFSQLTSILFHAEEESVEQPSTASAESGSSTLPQNELGEDMLQIAIRMASEMPDEPLDVEDSLNPTPINPGLFFLSILVLSDACAFNYFSAVPSQMILLANHLLPLMNAVTFCQ